MAKKADMKKGVKRFLGKKRALTRKTQFGGKIVNQKIQLPVAVWARANGLGTHTYSFSQSSDTNNVELYGLMTSATEFTNMSLRYNCFKINGVSLNAENVITGSSPLTAAPPIYFMMMLSVTGYGLSVPVANDNHYKVFPLDGSKNKSRYYSLSEPMNTGSGYPVTGVWIPSRATSTSSVYYVGLGYSDLPSGLPVSTNVQVLNLMCTVYVQWTCYFGI